MNVFLEAVIVGLALLPMVWLAEKLGLSKWVTLFVAGFGFHIIAEVTGVNAAYVKSKL